MFANYASKPSIVVRTWLLCVLLSYVGQGVSVKAHGVVMIKGTSEVAAQSLCHGSAPHEQRVHDVYSPMANPHHTPIDSSINSNFCCDDDCAMFSCFAGNALPPSTSLQLYLLPVFTEYFMYSPSVMASSKTLFRPPIFG